MASLSLPCLPNLSLSLPCLPNLCSLVFHFGVACRLFTGRRKMLRTLMTTKVKTEDSQSKWLHLDSDRDSKKCWARVVEYQVWMSLGATFIYLGILVSLARMDGMTGVDPFYFFATTVTVNFLSPYSHKCKKEMKKIALVPTENRKPPLPSSLRKPTPARLQTVGFGDLSPGLQKTRAIAIGARDPFNFTPHQSTSSIPHDPHHPSFV